MRRFAVILLWVFLFVIVVVGGTGAMTPIAGSKHDLSSTGPGPIKSASSGGTTEICVFCHTPHSAATITDAPLWNKSFDQTAYAGYQKYTSDVLTQMSYPDAEVPVKSGSQTIHVRKTRLCLSCHDGTIALGKLANVPPGIDPASGVSMVGTSGGFMPTTAVGYIGVDLRDDHPVAVQYKTGSPPGNDPELAGLPITGNVKVFNDTGVTNNNYVECTSCHNAHDNTYGNFLVEANSASQICTSCHLKAGFSGAAHDSSGAAYNAPNIGDTVGGVKCMDCHFPHKAGVSNTSSLPLAPAASDPRLGRYLLALQEEMSCYNEKNRWGQIVSSCHGPGGSGKDIKTEVAKASGHRMSDFTPGTHAATEDRDPVTPAVPKSDWVNSGGSLANWHVQCADCHNPHTAKNVSHVRPTNQVSSTSPLYGAGGWEPSSWPTWAGAPGSYSYIEPVGLITTTSPGVTKEYQVCFKCHTRYAWSSGAPTSPSFVPPASMTDQAKEFNATDSVSYHPVVQNTSAGIHQPSPPQGTLLAPWAAGKGAQTMYCSDCHTKENNGSPNGPHGSNNSYILSKPFDDQSGLQQPPVLPAQSSGDICFDCHDANIYLNPVQGLVSTGSGFRTSFNQNLHTQHAYREIPGNPVTISNPINYKCTNCHARIPHGWLRRSMIILQGEGATYGASYEATNGAKMQTFTPNTGSYSLGDCTTVAGCHHN